MNVVHVANSNGGAPYSLYVGQVLYNGAHLGWTAWWPSGGSCYQVANAEGVHLHLEMGQGVHSACFPQYQPATNLSVWDFIGAVGSNATWSPPHC